MKLQYRSGGSYGFKDWFELYHDGELIKSYRVWIDDSKEEADMLEEAGYTYGYTQAEVENARKRYLEMLERIIEAEV